MSADTTPTGLWNKQHAATYLGIAVNTLNHWICDRRIPFISKVQGMSIGGKHSLVSARAKSTGNRFRRSHIGAASDSRHRNNRAGPEKTKQ